MRKFLILLTSAALTVANFTYIGVTPAAAQEVSISRGQVLATAEGKRLGYVHRVLSDGTVQLIVDGKLVTIPAATISLTDGKFITSLTRKEALKR